MAKQLFINKEKCVGCGTCLALCPEGIKLAEDGKSEIIDEKKLEKCGGKEICPFGAIEEIK
ncbi:MAG: 4Fe-4S binding protein [Candidatus Nealsonbacteria bacterium]|nr:4Fe-4S binding protein [Candidatus Nealsonbacteria bacterium]